MAVHNLRIDIKHRDRYEPVVHDLSYEVFPGETLAIIGESGAGKTLSCRALIGLLPSSARVSGSIRLNGEELVGRSEPEMRRHRGADIAMVFQDVDGALNPTMRIGQQITEAIRVRGAVGRGEAQRRAVDLLALLGLPDPTRSCSAYPHQLSGGMRQRVVIAIAVANKPKLLIADEATRSLDLITQTDVLSLLTELQQQFGMALILISHSLALAAEFSNEVLVMHRGRLVEHAETSRLFTHPRMPYTKALLEAFSGAPVERSSGLGIVPRSRP